MIKRYQAFTLIELLVIIVIIAILASFIIVTMSGAQGSANDARRKADINQLSKAVMIYKSDHPDALLPISNNCNIGSDCSIAIMAILGNAAILRDPDSSNHYTYSSDGYDYIINSVLSNEENYYFDSVTGRYSISASSPPAPGNGVCGLSNSSSFYSSPIDNLCTFGTPSIVSGEGPWSWTCNGVTEVSCSANKNIDGICGDANNKEYAFGDSSYGGDTICSVGNPESIPDFPLIGGTSNWICSGQYEGLTATCSSSRAGLLGYLKRKNITISSTVELTDYQVKMVISYDSDMQPDFDDLRFTSPDGKTLYSYWLESKIDSSSAVIWVKVPAISNGNNQLYMYYGNNTVASNSNGDDTFVIFDDFNGSSINGSKWIAYGPPVVSGGVCLLTGTLWEYIKTRTLLGVNHRVVSMANPTKAYQTRHPVFQNSPGKIAGFVTNVASGIGKHNSYLTNTVNTSSNVLSLPDGYHRFEVIRNPGNMVHTVDGVLVSTLSTGMWTDEDAFVLFQIQEPEAQLSVDWVFVSKYISNEPVVVFGGEEG